jgi:PAS domain-containing protein
VVRGERHPAREPDGGHALAGVCLDITARRRAEPTRDLLAHLVAQAPVSIALFDRDLTYLAASRPWTAAVRPDLDDLRGRRHYDVPRPPRALEGGPPRGPRG